MSIKVTDKKIAFCGAHTLVTSTLLEGNFPDIERLIPNTFATKVKVNKNELLNMIEMGMLLYNTADANPIEFTISQEKFSVRMQNYEYGDYDEELGDYEIVEYGKTSDEEVRFALNPAYTRDALKALDGDYVLIGMNENTKPFVLTGDGGRLALLLPVRTYN